MSVFNRAVAIVFAAFLIVVGVISAYLTVAPPVEATAYVQGWSVYLADQLTAANRLFLGLAAGIATVAGALILLLETPKRPKTTVELKKINGGQGVLSVAAIAQRVQHDTELLAGVRRSKPTVFGRGNKVDVRLDLTTDPYVEAAAKTQEACQIVRDNVEGQMGVRVRRITVRITHDPIKNGTASRQTSDVS